MSELEDKILGVLKAKNLTFEVREHEAVYTNAVMAEKLGVPVGETVKSLVLESTDGKILLVALPGDKRFDAKRVAELAGVKKVTFAKPEKVVEYAGCTVGSVPPFGHPRPIPVFMDPDLLSKPWVYFNPGVHTKSIKLEGARLKDLCNATML